MKPGLRLLRTHQPASRHRHFPAWPKPTNTRLVTVMPRNHAPLQLTLWILLATCAVGADPATAAPIAQPRKHVPVRLAYPAQSHFSLVNVDAADVVPGGRTTLRVLVANKGPDQTASPFEVSIRLPQGTSAEGPYFPDSCRAGTAMNAVSCTFPAGLPVGRTATVLITIRVQAAAHANASLPGEVTISSPDDPGGIVRGRCALHTILSQPGFSPPEEIPS